MYCFAALGLGVILIGGAFLVQYSGTLVLQVRNDSIVAKIDIFTVEPVVALRTMLKPVNFMRLC